MTDHEDEDDVKKIFKFDTRETPGGCTVTRLGPKHIQHKRFRNGHLHSTAGAKQWIAADIRCILDTVEAGGLPMPEIYVDGELVQHYNAPTQRTKHPTQRTRVVPGSWPAYIAVRAEVEKPTHDISRATTARAATATAIRWARQMLVETQQNHAEHLPGAERMLLRGAVAALAAAGYVIK